MRRGAAVRRFLAGDDGPGRRALPLGEFLHPVPLVALLVLVVNDHALKGHGPAWLTGKLSDFAGVLFFPLLLTALGDVAACGVARVSGARIDFSLRRWKLAAGLAATAGIMLGLELSPGFGAGFTRALSRFGVPSATTPDPWDLTALVMLVPAWWLGRSEIARVPLGRLEVIRRRGGPAGPMLADVRRLRGAVVDELAAAIDRGDDEGATAALRGLRA